MLAMLKKCITVIHLWACLVFTPERACSQIEQFRPKPGLQFPVTLVKAYNPDNAVDMQPFHVLRPNPQSQIDVVLNKDVFEQNPGINRNGCFDGMADLPSSLATRFSDSLH